MSDSEIIKKKQIKKLPTKDSITDDDLYIIDNGVVTYKITANDIAKYISTNQHITDAYINKNLIGVSNGITPLNADEKIDGRYVTYGNTAFTAYEGSAGKILEENLDNHLTDKNAHGYGARLDNMYTKNEVDNKFYTLETNIDWKESVDTYDDILTTYPNPEKGWTVNADNTTYRYDGSEWVDIGITAIPKATTSVDGLMTSSDKSKLDNVEENANNYTLPSATDTTLGGVSIGNNITNDGGLISITKKNVTDALGFTPGSSTSIVAYTLEKDGNNIKLVGNDGSESSVEDKDTTYTDFVGATSESDGEDGLVPKPLVSDKDKYLKGDGTFNNPPDTKNTAGSTDTEDKLFLIGTKAQSNAAVTYSHSSVYIDEDGDLCSDDTKVSTVDHTHEEYVNIIYSDTEPTTQRVGDYWCKDYE